MAAGGRPMPPMQPAAEDCFKLRGWSAGVRGCAGTRARGCRGHAREARACLVLDVNRLVDIHYLLMATAGWSLVSIFLGASRCLFHCHCCEGVGWVCGLHLGSRTLQRIGAWEGQNMC